MRTLIHWFSHRLGQPRRHGQTRPRDIIVRFVRYRDRASVYNNKTNLKRFNDNKNNGYRIFINKALTRRRPALISKARQVVRSWEAKGTWTYDGKIYLRRKDGKKWSYDTRRICTISARKVLGSIRTFTKNLIPRKLLPRTSLAPNEEVAIRTRSSVTLRWSKQSTPIRNKSLC